jgi:hypothetical protein
MMFLLLAFFAAGCAHVAQPVATYAYSWGTIARYKSADLSRICLPRGGAADDGRPLTPNYPVEGCADVAGRKIYVEDSCEGAKALPHELAHLDGHKNPEADGFGWK